MKVSTLSTACLVALVVLASGVSAAKAGRELLQGVPDCGAGFFYKPFDNSCMRCDDRCLPGNCLNIDGCVQCEAGFFTSRADPEWPLLCKRCDIGNCLKCRDDIFDQWPQQCVLCAAGFVQGEDRKSCIPDNRVAGIDFSKPVPPPAARRSVATTTVTNTNTVPSFAPSAPVVFVETGPVDTTTTVGGEELQRAPPAFVSPVQSRCPAGAFFKSMDNSCMRCDDNCAPGACVDDDGCRQCVAGFHTSKADPEWPSHCVRCNVENCAVCLDDQFDQWPQFCAQCAPGFALVTRELCAPANSVGGQTFSRRQAPPPPVVVVPAPAPAPRVAPVDIVRPVAPAPAPVSYGGARRARPPPPPPAPVAPETIIIETRLPSGSVQGDSLEKPFPPPGVGDETAARCPAGSFLKTFDNTCMRCDEFCAPGACVNALGCTKCIDGSRFLSSPDPEWPFTCELCTIAGCDLCVGGVFDAWPVRCERCAPGFQRTRDGSACL